MGRGASQPESGANLLYGTPDARFRLSGRFTSVSGLQLPSLTARPESGLDAWIVIGSLAEDVKDDSAWEMFAHLVNATMTIRVEHKGGKAVSEDLRRDKVIAAFSEARSADPGLAAWEFDEIQWDVCMHAVSEAHRAGGFDGASLEEIASTYRHLCGVGIEERGSEEILCAVCRQAISYRVVSGEAWREGFGYCGRICGGCVK